MKKVWKWILGIAAVLVVIGLLFGAVFFLQRGFPFGRGTFAYRQYPQTAPSNPQNNQSPNFPNRPMPGRGYGWGYGYGPMMERGPMMMSGRGFDHFGTFMPFGPFGMMGFMFFGFFRLLIPLGVLVLVAYIFYQMGKRAGRSAVVPPPSAPTSVPVSENNPQN